MSRRTSAIVPRALASEDILATPSAIRLAARNAAKPPVSILTSATTARRAALDKRAPVRRRSPEVTTPPSVQSTPPSVIPLDSPPHGGFSPGAVGRSVAAAIAPLLAQQSSKKLKMAAAPGDLAAPMWIGELEVVTQSDKLVVFEAARLKYVATCNLSEHAPAPVKEAFNVQLVPTLRRWLGMPKGTALCADWVVLTPELDAAIMPLLKMKFVVETPMSLRASLKVLRFRPFSHSWLDLRCLLGSVGRGHFQGAKPRSFPPVSRPRGCVQGRLRGDSLPL